MSNDNVLINATFGKTGIIRTWTEVTSLAQGKLSAEAFAVAALGMRLTHDALRQHFNSVSSIKHAKAFPVGDTEVFLCACGRRLFSPGEAIKHVERTHANAALRRDLDALEDTIEALITPSPLTDWSDETLLTKSFGPQLVAEFAQLFADCDKLDFGNPVTKEHGDRAKDLVGCLGWDKMKGLTYKDLKEPAIRQ